MTISPRAVSPLRRRLHRRSRRPGFCWSGAAAPFPAISSRTCAMRLVAEQVDVAAPLAAVVADDPRRLGPGPGPTPADLRTLPLSGSRPPALSNKGAGPIDRLWAT